MASGTEGVAYMTERQIPIAVIKLAEDRGPVTLIFESAGEPPRTVTLVEGDSLTVYLPLSALNAEVFFKRD